MLNLVVLLFQSSARSGRSRSARARAGGARRAKGAAAPRCATRASRPSSAPLPRPPPRSRSARRFTLLRVSTLVAMRSLRPSRMPSEEAGPIVRTAYTYLLTMFSLWQYGEIFNRKTQTDSEIIFSCNLSNVHGTYFDRIPTHSEMKYSLMKPHTNFTSSKLGINRNTLLRALVAGREYCLDLLIIEFKVLLFCAKKCVNTAYLFLRGT